MITNENEQLAGKHACFIYNDQQELQETLKSLSNPDYCKNERNIFIFENRLLMNIGDYIKHNLQDQQRETCLFYSTEDIHLKNDHFDPFQTIRILLQQVREAKLEGFKSVKYIIDMNWSICDNWALMDYETRINQYLIPQYPCSAVCLYNLKRFNPYLLKSIITQHPQIINKSNIIENRYYNRPNPFLGQRNGQDEVQALLKRISLEKCPAANTNVKHVDQINNCYRAILAIVNYLGSICSRREYLTDIYQDLSEMAYYIMDNNKYCLLKSIEQLTISVNELENEFKLVDKEKSTIIILTLNEIRTHMQYLHIQFSQRL